MRYAVLITVTLGFAGQPPAYGSQALKAPNKHTLVEKNMSQQYDQAMQQLGIFKATRDVTALSSVISLASAMPNAVSQVPQAGQSLAKDKLSLWFAIFNALDAEIAIDFNPDEVPELTVEPPPESGLPAGVSPASIKDPTVRKAYENALTANGLKNQRYRYQYALSQENLRAESEVEKFIASATASDPAHVPILQDRLAHAKLQPQRMAKLHALLVPAERPRYRPA